MFTRLTGFVAAGLGALVFTGVALAPDKGAFGLKFGLGSPIRGGPFCPSA